MGICEKLNKIQVSLNAPKNQRNNFGNYNYRSCEDILEAVKQLLKEHKCVLKISDNIELIGDRYYIKSTATIKDCETSEEESCTAYAREEESKKGMDSSQLTGATSSYARKYALNGLLAIDDCKDSDSTNTHGKTSDKPKKDNTAQQQNKTYKCKNCGADVPENVAKYSYSKFKKILCLECQKAVK